MRKLEFLLQRSGIYSRIMGEKLQRAQSTQDANADAKPKAKRARTEAELGTLAAIARREQPKLITGAELKPYQMDGLIWLSSLYENGLNGILADEMGLGKTLQTIAFLAHLYEKGIKGVFLIVAPLSTMSNWHNEFARFTPAIPTLLYHGAKNERTSLQKKVDPEKVSVVITSYEIVIRDRQFLSRLPWKFIVVDEGHRLKNLNCRLLRELKQFKTGNRLILTGTPLHNNLAELWSLLNFVLPDIFDDLATFEQWFNFGAAEDDAGEVQSATSSFSTWSTETARRVVQQLHGILKPFLLRRVKSEVEQDLPPKKEYLLYAPLSHEQAEMYNQVINGTFRDWLIAYKAGIDMEQLTAMRDQPQEEQTSRTRKRTSTQVQKKHEQLREAERTVRNMRLDNAMMQLRKICCHPYLLDWPVVGDTDRLRVDSGMVRASGKLRMLDQMLDALLEQGHRVLIFSQFTTMLDILELWAKDVKRWSPYRIDGSTSQTDRADQISQFNDAPFSKEHAVFLLSTRASGLGINLVGADTVIFFDSDWNPQMDLQAQDRVHRIGQNKPVLVFRLVASDTVEQEILKKAKAKRVLESVVIKKGKFRNPITHAEITEKNSADENGDLALATTKVDVQAGDDDEPLIGPTDLERLLDRSPEAYARTFGWQSTEGAQSGTGTQKHSDHALFEVTETSQQAANPTLARIFSGEVDHS